MDFVPKALSKLFKASKKSGVYVGVACAANSLAVAVFKRQASGYELIHAEYLEAAQGEHLEQLQKITDAHNLKDAACQLVLMSGLYQTVQNDKPNVPDNEVAQALLWSIKDLISITPANTVIDFYDLPAGGIGGQKINIVAADSEKLQPMIDMVSHAGLTLEAITVQELATRSLIAPSDEAVMLLSQMPNDELQLTLVKSNMIYVSRTIRGFARLSLMSPMELESGMLDNLSLEIQRSLDYFESSLRQSPVKRIMLAIPSMHPAELTQGIANNFSIPVVRFELATAHQDVSLAEIEPEIGTYPALGGLLELVNEELDS